jgi:hypothetical protein
MRFFDSRTYNISDFVEWQNSGLLELDPDFQRRSVWPEKAKSYLIDTILRGLPIPKLIIHQKMAQSRNIRVVIDGQQRLRSIFEYINNNFKISKIHNEDLSQFYFDELPEDIRDSFFQFELGVDVIFNITYEEMLDIFQRLNSFTATLKPQEILNSKYLGYFKNYVFDYGRKYAKYFIDGEVLTKYQVTRMAEAELSTNFFVALINGVQTNKNNETFYRIYEDEENELPAMAIRYDEIMSIIGEIYPPDELKLTNWSRVHLFYTLFTSIGHLKYGLNGPSVDYRFPLSLKEIGKLRIILDEISSKYDDVSDHLDDENYPFDYKEFIDFSRRRTTDTKARIERANFVCKKIFDYLSK